MQPPEISRRIAAELRKPDIVSAGLLHVYYPVPAKIVEGPSALVVTGSGSMDEMQEQIWHHEWRVQLMVPIPSPFANVAGINALEPLIMPIFDHFKPRSAARQLIVADQPGAVTHCYPTRYEASQVIDYGAALFAAITIYFDVKDHRFPGDA